MKKPLSMQEKRLIWILNNELSPEDGDFYIDDRLHYQLSVISKAVLADVDHKTNGLWYWVHEEGTPSLRACLS